jgi:hypothetical protein
MTMAAPSPMPNSDLVVSTETGGLGNRLKSWVSSMRLASDARVHWPVTKNMPAGFGELFSNDCAVDGIPGDAAVYASWRLAILPQDERCLPAGFATAGAGAHPLVRGLGKVWWSFTGQRTDRYRYMLYPKSYSRRATRADARHIDFEYERIPQCLRDVYCPLFRSVAVQPAILRRAEEWANENLGADRLGVQVRTWRDDPRRHAKYHPAAWRRLQRSLDAMDPRLAIFVVSDSDEIMPPLRARYGTRVTSFPRRTRRAESWQSVDGIVEDLIDMLLLSRSQRLLTSYLSTFGETAWWLGGACAAVEVF